MRSAKNGVYVVMGVAGSGKSLIGAEFAKALQVAFVEGDDYHPTGNIARMAAGIALTDGDRAGWLRSLGARIRDTSAADAGLVMTCSALKRAYRDVLRVEAAAPLRFIFLRGDRKLIATRLATRSGHFMPPSLLDSQFATLEEPSPDEDAWVCDIRESPADLIAALVKRATA